MKSCKLPKYLSSGVIAPCTSYHAAPGSYCSRLDLSLSYTQEFSSVPFTEWLGGCQVWQGSEQERALGIRGLRYKDLLLLLLLVPAEVGAIGVLSSF